MKTKAAVCYEFDTPLVVEELDLKEHPGSGEIRVRLVGSGVCNTDMHAQHTGWAETGYKDELPMIFGHEGAGYVEEIGPGVTEFAPGDKVVLSYPWCGKCEWCISGKPWNCPNYVRINHYGKLDDGKAPFTKDGDEVNLFFGFSSFANDTVCRTTNATKVDCSDEDLPKMAALGCGVITGVGAVMGQLAPRPGSSIVVFGAGGVGCSAIMAAKICNCTTIVAVDIDAGRLELAKELGATHVFNTKLHPEIDVVEEVRKLTGGKGANYSIETTSIPEITKQCIAVLATEGHMSQIGVPPQVTLDSFYFDLWGKTVSINSMGNVHPRTFIPEMVEWYKRGQLPIDKLVKYYTLDQINEAMADSTAGRTIKPIIVY